MAMAITAAAAIFFHKKSLQDYLAWAHHHIFYSQGNILVTTGAAILWDTNHFAHATWRWLKKQGTKLTREQR
jgi:hypothetical protein